MLKNPFVRFVILASALFLFWYILFEFWIDKHSNLNRILIESLIDISGFILQLFGFTLIPEPPADIIVRTIGIDGTTGVWVGDPCNGLEILAIFSIFMIAVPGPWKQKLWYWPMGMLCIHLINSIRIAVLAWLQSFGNEFVNFNHDYTFKIVVYSSIFVLWIIWIRKFVPTKKIA